MPTKAKPAQPDPAEDEAQQAQPEPEEGSEPSGSGVSLGSLDARLDRLEDIVTNFVKGGAGPKKITQADQSADVAAQVRAEVAKIRKSDADQQAKEDRIKQVEAKVKELAEVPPREYRRVTTFLWGQPDE